MNVETIILDEFVTTTERFSVPLRRQDHYALHYQYILHELGHAKVDPDQLEEIRSLMLRVDGVSWTYPTFLYASG